MFVQYLPEVIDRLTRYGFIVTAYPTQGPRDGYRFALENTKSYSRLICSGGDGMLNEMINALMLNARRPLFGYIPSGTTNDFAHSLNIPSDILLATDTIIKGSRRNVDIGRFGNTWFAYVAAFGLFTDVSYLTTQDMKNTFGHLAYVLESVRRLGSIKSIRCTVVLDNETVEGEYILGMVANSSYIAGFQTPVTTTPSLDDGLFEVFLVRRPRRFLDLQRIISALAGNGSAGDLIVFRKSASVRIISQESIPWTLDGEFGGDLSDITIENCPGAITMLAPRNPSA